MRALGRVVRSDEAANEVVAAGGLAPIVKLLDCSDAGIVRRSAVHWPHITALAWVPN